MEVTHLETEISRDERERLIRGILDCRTGIYGVEVCQYCGRFGTFTGHAGAAGSHFSGEFVSMRHHHGDPVAMRELMRDRPRRYCEMCRARVERPENGSLRQWLCDACARDLPSETDWRALSDALHTISRRRYVEGKSDAELQAWAKVAGVETPDQ